MELNLSPELEAFVDHQVTTGAFDSAESVISSALTCLQALTVKAKIMEGYKQSLAGEFSDRSIEDIIRERQAHFEGTHASV